MKCDQVALNLRPSMGENGFTEKVRRAYNAKIRATPAIS